MWYWPHEKWHYRARLPGIVIFNDCRWPHLIDLSAYKQQGKLFIVVFLRIGILSVQQSPKWELTFGRGGRHLHIYTRSILLYDWYLLDIFLFLKVIFAINSSYSLLFLWCNSISRSVWCTKLDMGSQDHSWLLMFRKLKGMNMFDGSLLYLGRGPNCSLYM